MMAAAAASAEAPLTLTATTTGAAESVTIARMTLRVASRIDWGDGTYTEMTANDEAPKLHTYAVAGTYRVAVFRVGDVTQVQLDSAKIGGLNTQQLRRSPIVYFSVTAITGSAIDSADMVGWTPTYWRLYSMPAAGSSYTFGAAIMRNWTSAASIACQDLALLVGVVDAILLDIYTGRAGYTNAAPVLNVGGSNAAPSGVYQDAAPPTTGLEYKYKLVVDPDAEGFNKWAITS